MLADSDNYINGYVVAEKEGLALGWSKWDMRKGSVELEIKLTVPNALAGVVVDENDKPVPAARVSISYLHINKQYLPRPFAPSLLSTDTGADGKFTFTNLPLGTTADFTVENAGVTVLNNVGGQSGYGLSGKDGIIRIRLMPGEYFLLDGVYKQGYSIKGGEEPFAIADGKTERWEYAIVPESLGG